MIRGAASGCVVGDGDASGCLNPVVDESHLRYIALMKTATIPPVRIEPTFREEIEQALDEGESLASLVETAVRHEITRRQTQSEFIRRGIAAIDRTVAEGDGIAPATVIARLEAKLAEARKTRQA
jgi:hypothetical protein